jgi:single-strand DNA-binding protein
MNYLHLAGHLGADPEVRFTSSGLKVTALRVAARARKKAGEDRTIWWRVTVWGEQFDKMIAHFKKGSSIMVMGELEEPQIYNDREGKPAVSMSMTASQLMFSPFGRNERKDEPRAAQPVQADNNVSSLENAFDSAQGFTSGEAKSPSNDLFPSDEEIPF